METQIGSDDTFYWEFFKKQSELQLIPSLQRPYTWGNKEINKLWDDMLTNESPYYIGSIVAIAAKGSTKYDEIIDGQQRLVTLSLLLIALKQCITGQKEFYDIEDEIMDMLSRPKRRSDDQIRLQFTNENSNNYYNHLVEGKKWLDEDLTETQKKIENNYKLFLKKIKQYSPACEFEEIDLLFDKIKYLQIIFIKCLDRSAAYKLFESINATSVSLASTDMIKNEIFSKIYQSKREHLKKAEDDWQDMFVEEFNENSTYFKTYIRHQWLSVYGYVSHAGLFDEFCRINNSIEDVEKYLKQIVSDASVYNSLKNANIENLKHLPGKRFEKIEIKEGLEFISFLGVDQVYSVLLYLYQNSKKDFKKDVNRLAAFQFLYKYVPGSPSEPEKKYYANLCTGKITKVNAFNGMLQLCRNQKLSFVDKFTEKIKYVSGRSGDIQFILEKYIYNGADNTAKFKNPTIEHIISQKYDADVLAQFDNDDKLVKKIINKIGNLTILEESENSSNEYSNEPFKIKKTSFQKNIYKGNQDICKYDFNKEIEMSINKRGDDVADEIYDIALRALETGKWN